MQRVIWTLAFAGVLTLTPLLSADPPSGTWTINGDGYSGVLVLKLAADGTVNGTVYEQPIVGMYYAKTKRLNFVRVVEVGNSLPTYQSFQGYWFQNEEGGKMKHTIAGMFTATRPGTGINTGLPEAGWYAQIVVKK